MAAISTTRVDVGRWRTVAGLGVDDLALALLLSVGMVALVTGHLGSDGRHGGAIVALVAVIMTAPVGWRRRAPVIAAGVLLLGSLVNDFGIGPMVRCGPALPALFLVAYAIGRRHGSWHEGLLACVLLLGCCYLDVHYDPEIRAAGLPMATVLGLIVVGFWGAGRMLRSRQAIVSALSAQTEELRRQRDGNAALAVAADRGRIADDVHRDLERQLGGVLTLAQDVRHRAIEEPAATQVAFAEIQRAARSTLDQLRRSVGAVLSDDNPHQPPPVLAGLRDLVQLCGASTRLVIEGDPRALPAGLELSAYRIVERLVDVLAVTPGAQIEVSMDFGTEELEIGVSVLSKPSQARGLDGAVAAARERAALHGGTLVTTAQVSGWSANAHLPVALAAR